MKILCALLLILMSALLCLGLFTPGRPGANLAAGFIIAVLVFLPLRSVFRGALGRGDDSGSGRGRGPGGSAPAAEEDPDEDR